MFLNNPFIRKASFFRLLSFQKETPKANSQKNTEDLVNLIPAYALLIILRHQNRTMKAET